eukprot:CAMPEP_0174827804 /NCGR_PEP_ID=MMETSP1114-20130205/939_1 /TAXON_ID=312471 /ORGANISM="Neobodo designis, Strain CCAP 1951/1" /LENGTH=195 /DNA_ID=CAMNT_0016061481 /DNA_START=141 /DNA_END=728 /DNA_ORIENTATION=+
MGCSNSKDCSSAHIAAPRAVDAAAAAAPANPLSARVHLAVDEGPAEPPLVAVLDLPPDTPDTRREHQRANRAATSAVGAMTHTVQCDPPRPSHGVTRRGALPVVPVPAARPAAGRQLEVPASPLCLPVTLAAGTKRLSSATLSAASAGRTQSSGHDTSVSAWLADVAPAATAAASEAFPSAFGDVFDDDAPTDPF